MKTQEMTLERAIELAPTIAVPTAALLSVTQILANPSLLMEAKVGEIEALKRAIGNSIDAALKQAMADSTPAQS